MSMAEEKKTLRRVIKQRQSELHSEYREEADRKIISLFLSTSEYTKARCIFAFVGTGAEIDTAEILRAALKDGKRLCVPLCVGRGVMEAREIRSPDELQPGAFGIPEPPDNTQKVDITQINLALVPCVSCSHDGKRLGHGGGYYDRFLENFPGKTIMLCYEKLIRENIPTESHDQIILPVITEIGVFR